MGMFTIWHLQRGAVYPFVVYTRRPVQVGRDMSLALSFYMSFIIHMATNVTDFYLPWTQKKCLGAGHKP